MPSPPFNFLLKCPAGVEIIPHTGEPITVGAALRMMVPELFLSTRANLIAKPVIHGIVIPLNTPLVELMKEASYPDGFLHVAVAMMS